VRCTIIDEQATKEQRESLIAIDGSSARKEQRESLIAIDGSQHGNTFFEIFAAVSPNRMEPLVAPIIFNVDPEKRRATIRIQGIAESECITC
jgi:hypothetical protein